MPWNTFVNKAGQDSSCHKVNIPLQGRAPGRKKHTNDRTSACKVCTNLGLSGKTSSLKRWLMNGHNDLNGSDFQISERRVNSTCKGSETKWTKPHRKKTTCLRLRPLEGRCWKGLEGQGGAALSCPGGCVLLSPFLFFWSVHLSLLRKLFLFS